MSNNKIIITTIIKLMIKQTTLYSEKHTTQK